MLSTWYQIVIFLVFIPQLCFAQVVSHPFIPREGKLLIIGQQKDAIEEYVKSTKVIPGGFMVYTSIQIMDALDRPGNHGAGIQHAQYYIKRYPDTVIQLGLYMVGAVDKILTGMYDDNILKLAKWMKKAQRPIYFRIGYEFDLPDNRYDPKKYQQAYRYIVDRLRNQGVNNVAYVWHSAAMMESKGILWIGIRAMIMWIGLRYQYLIQCRLILLIILRL
ncbi:MAG: hypothetical protein HQL25_00115 [Candidatus Omnitrophica bacterium]|nr:hypothetical protein [Candidatus Omnitrophota bacterium]